MSNQPPNPNTTRIIIIAVLVVVMILGSLTALWLILNPMGPTFAFTKNDQFQVNSIVFGGTPSNATNYINMTIQNTGSSALTITNTAQVNSLTDLTVSSTYGLTCAPGYSITVKIANVNWTDGNQCSITLLLTDGNKISYVANAEPGGHSPDSNPNPSPIIPGYSSPPPSPIAYAHALMAIIGSALATNTPLIGASLSAIAEIVVGVGVLVYIRKHVNCVSDIIIPAACIMILVGEGAFITFCLVSSYLTPPLTFSLHLGF